MAKDTFEQVDGYIENLFVPRDQLLDAGIERARKAGMPEIQISAGQGKFLNLLAKMIGAKRILEIGTLAGYSTIWLARALPAGGKLVTLEFSPEHAKVARANIASVGLTSQIEVIEGAALDSLAKLVARGEAPFDLIFIDADKDNYANYLDWTVKLCRPGGLILADNVVRAGAVMAPDKADLMAVGAATFNAKLAADKRLEAIILQQVGVKGHDGLAIARVR